MTTPAQITRYVFWGSLNTGVSLLIYWGLLFVNMPIWLSNLVAMIGGILLGHFLNKHLVFRSKETNTLIKYFTMWAFLYIISTGLILLFVKFGSDKYLAGLWAGLVLIPVAFVIQKLKIFAA